MRPFVTAKTNDMYDHIKPTQMNFQPNVYISRLGTNDLLTPEEISDKNITFFKHLKSDDNDVVVSGIVPRGDSYKEKAEAVNKVLKDTCTKENMHFICHSNINVKRHLNRSNLHLNDNGISALVRNFKNFSNNFESVGLQNKHNLFTTGHGPLTSKNSESCFSINNDILRIRKQRIDNALNTIIGHLKVNSMRNKFVLVENIIKTSDIFRISESKLDCTFPLSQFRIAGFKYS